MFKLMGKKIIAILHSIFMIDIPLAMPLRKSMIKSQSVDESSPRNAGKSSRLPGKIIFLIPQPKHMLWVFKRTVSMRRFF